MFEQTHQGVELSVFNMYGLVDIRAGHINRTAQVYHNGVWKLNVYWEENGEYLADWKTHIYPTKEKAVSIGKDWVALGIRPDRRWNDGPKS